MESFRSPNIMSSPAFIQKLQNGHLKSTKPTYFNLVKASPCPPKTRKISILMSKVFEYWESSSCFLPRELKPTSQTMPYSPRSKFKGKFLHPLLITPETDSLRNWRSLYSPVKKLLPFSQILSPLQLPSWLVLTEWSFSWYPSYHLTKAFS